MADTYTTEAIACGLSDVAGWLENEGGREKHARTIRLGVERLRELGAAGGEGEKQRRDEDGFACEYDPGCKPETDTYTILWDAGARWLIVDRHGLITAGRSPADGQPVQQTTWDALTKPAAPSHPGEAERVGPGEWTCAARCQGTAGGNAPADCDWPVCGCDPYADKVIAALQESGHLVSASLAALGTREGSGGASPAGSGSSLSGEAPEGSSSQATAIPRAAFDISDRVLIEAITPTLQRWLDWCGQNGEEPDARSGASEAMWALRAALGTEAEGQDAEGGLVHEGPAPQGATPSPLPHPQAPNTLSEVKEATALLLAIDGVLRAAQQEAYRLRDETDGYGFPNWLAQENHEKADRIEAALATLRGEVSDV